MWYPATVTQAAANEPLTADDAKRQSRIGFADDDDYIDTLIAAIRDHTERYCNIRLVTQTVVVKCDAFADFSRFPVAPVQGISSIGYLDAAGDEQTLGAGDYELRNDGLEVSIAKAYGATWPAVQPGSRITVTAVVGYSETNPMPPAIKHAILLRVADAYEVRENAADADWSAFDSLLSNFRRGA